MGSWTLEQIRENQAIVRTALDDLLGRRLVAKRPNSRQWKFLRACLDHLITGAGSHNTPASKTQAAQYKFEIEDRLRKFYRAPGAPVSLVFALESRDRALGTDAVPESYPSTNGYVLLVSDARPENVERLPKKALEEYLLRVVNDAAQAELEAYRRLPTVDLSVLESAFVRNSDAVLRIQNVLEAHAKKEWCLTSPIWNPSTMRMIKTRVLEVGMSRAIVGTQEYWYLRWWSLQTQKYVNVYNDTNSQRYFLVHEGERWLVETNAYAHPRMATTQRKPRP